jgi:hypothetical protein
MAVSVLTVEDAGDVLRGQAVEVDVVVVLDRGRWLADLLSRLCGALNGPPGWRGWQ